MGIRPVRGCNYCNLINLTNGDQHPKFTNKFDGNPMRRLFIAAALIFISGCSFNQKNTENANSCITGAPVCEDVNRDKLEPTLRLEFDKFIKKRDQGFKNAQNKRSKQKEIIAEKRSAEKASLEAEELALLPEKCKKYIGEIMGRDPISMTTDYERNAEKIAGISYIRQDDGKLFKYECTINGDSIVWRGVDLFRQGEGPGRWRTEDAKALSSI